MADWPPLLPRRYLGEPPEADARPGTAQRTFAIVTCKPDDLVATIHDRMPVILHEKDYARWLGDLDPSDLLAPFPSELMKIWPVSMRVNNVHNQDANLLDPVEPQEPGLL
jgi:putative SOS response-associated peptidase YedK